MANLRDPLIAAVAMDLDLGIHQQLRSYGFLATMYPRPTAVDLCSSHSKSSSPR